MKEISAMTIITAEEEMTTATPGIAAEVVAITRNTTAIGMPLLLLLPLLYPQLRLSSPRLPRLLRPLVLPGLRAWLL